MSRIGARVVAGVGGVVGAVPSVLPQQPLIAVPIPRFP